jgi:serine/threonine protein kinase
MSVKDIFGRKPEPGAPRPAKWPRVPTVEDLDFGFQRAKDSPGIPAAMSWKRTETSNFIMSVTWETLTQAGEATWVMQVEEMGDLVVLWSFRSREAPIIHKLMVDAIAQLDPANQPPEGDDEALKNAQLKPGTIVDRYEIIEEIGYGGMGVVYRGRDLMFERPVAIKVLHSRLLSDPLSKRRFEQEGRATITLAHPNLISVYHYGFSNNGLPFIVMEYVNGKGLDRKLEKEKQLKLEQFVEIFLQACDALGHAHEKGIIHRDLKPSNLMLVDNGTKFPLVKIVDFGISKILPNGRFPGQDLTSAGDVVGSPLYMSPEQCKGLTLDGRSDIYSLGCLMYQAISGALPFLGENALQTLSKHICDSPPPFKQVVPKLNIPAEVEEVIFRTLEKEPDNRYATVADLRADLEKLTSRDVLNLTTTTLAKVTSTATAGSVHILVETEELPKATLEAAVKVQKMIREGTLTLTQAADALQKAHTNHGTIDLKSYPPSEHAPGLVVDTPLEAVLVEAGLISNAVWRTLLQLQTQMRSGAMTKEEAVAEFRKRHPQGGGKAAKNNNGNSSDSPSSVRIAVVEVNPTNPVDLLKHAGIITEQDIEAAKKLDADKGNKLEKYLVTLGKIDTKTVLDAYQCVTLLNAKRLRVEQAVIALNFCQRSRVSFNEAVAELGYELSK